MAFFLINSTCSLRIPLTGINWYQPVSTGWTRNARQELVCHLGTRALTPNPIAELDLQFSLQNPFCPYNPRPCQSSRQHGLLHPAQNLTLSLSVSLHLLKKLQSLTVCRKDSSSYLCSINNMPGVVLSVFIYYILESEETEC